jgi:DNA modification methylase
MAQDDGSYGGDQGPQNADTVVPAVQGGPITTEVGDVWKVGPHRLICGSALDPNVLLGLMDGEEAEMVFTDPPYNVKADTVANFGRLTHEDFEMAAGEMTREQFVEFLRLAFQNAYDHSQDGAIHYICMDWRHMLELCLAGEAVYEEQKNLCVWNKDNAGMGAFYRSKHELVFVYKKGSAKHINNFDLGQHGRHRTNVWDYVGSSATKGSKNPDLKMHPTMKPLPLVADAVLDCSNRGGIVLDVFAGSGTTLIAAHNQGRIGYGVELSPVFCDLIVRRLQIATDEEAVLEATGQKYGDVTDERNTPVDDTPEE